MAGQLLKRRASMSLQGRAAVSPRLQSEQKNMNSWKIEEPAQEVYPISSTQGFAVRAGMHSAMTMLTNTVQKQQPNHANFYLDNLDPSVFHEACATPLDIMPSTQLPNNRQNCHLSPPPQPHQRVACFFDTKITNVLVQQETLPPASSSPVLECEGSGGVQGW